MKNVLLLISSLILISCKTKFTENNSAQREINYISYYSKANEADSLFLANDYNNAYRILDSLFKEYEPLNSLNLYEYNTFLIASFKTHHLNNLTSKVQKCYRDFGGLMAGNNLKDSILKAANLTNNDIAILKHQYRMSLNDSLRLQIISMQKDDQRTRSGGNNSEAMIYYDKINETKLDTIFKKYGYPSEKLIGSISYFGQESTEELANPIGILIHQGSDKDAKTKLLPLLLDFVKKGKCSPYVYASVYDKHEIVYTHKQYYNSFIIADVARDTSLINRKKNDDIRKSIGLPSLSYEQWKFFGQFEE